MGSVGGMVWDFNRGAKSGKDYRWILDHYLLISRWKNCESSDGTGEMAASY